MSQSRWMRGLFRGCGRRDRVKETGHGGKRPRFRRPIMKTRREKRPEPAAGWVTLPAHAGHVSLRLDAEQVGLLRAMRSRGRCRIKFGPASQNVFVAYYLGQAVQIHRWRSLKSRGLVRCVSSLLSKDRRWRITDLGREALEAAA